MWTRLTTRPVSGSRGAQETPDTPAAARTLVTLTGRRTQCLGDMGTRGHETLDLWGPSCLWLLGSRDLRARVSRTTTLLTVGPCPDATP